jgi:hypothetical protein
VYCGINVPPALTLTVPLNCVVQLKLALAVELPKEVAEAVFEENELGLPPVPDEKAEPKILVKPVYKILFNVAAPANPRDKVCMVAVAVFEKTTTISNA